MLIPAHESKWQRNDVTGASLFLPNLTVMPGRPLSRSNGIGRVLEPWLCWRSDAVVTKRGLWLLVGSSCAKVTWLPGLCGGAWC